jgi:mRNA interferase RelE/StbE
MYQVTFSDQSSRVFKALPMERQLRLVDELSALTPSVLEEAKEPIGSFKRADTVYYRYRTDDLRFYFTLEKDTIGCIYIMSKNTWADFRLRSNLEKLSDAEVESRPNFLKLLEGE